jgi:hypothetical protein
MVDLMTVVPIFVMFGNTCPALAASNTSWEVLEFILCALGTTRILRALRLRRRFVMIEDEVQQFLANMCLNIIVMILFSTSAFFSNHDLCNLQPHFLDSALMQYLEPDQGLAFHTCKYIYFFFYLQSLC